MREPHAPVLRIDAEVHVWVWAVPTCTKGLEKALDGLVAWEHQGRRHYVIGIFEASVFKLSGTAANVYFELCAVKFLNVQPTREGSRQV
ncbi:MAG: hypothetical protein ACK56I_26735, partial [bacterium]